MFADPIKQEIFQAESLEDMLNVFKKHYNTEGCKPGAMVKSGFVMKLDDLIRTTGVQKRTVMNFKQPAAQKKTISEILKRKRK